MIRDPLSLQASGARRQTNVKNKTLLRYAKTKSAHNKRPKKFTTAEVELSSTADVEQRHPFQKEHIGYAKHILRILIRNVSCINLTRPSQLTDQILPVSFLNTPSLSAPDPLCFQYQ